MKKEKGNILIIDDDEFIRLSIKMMLEEVYETVNTLDDPKKLIPELNQKSYDIILLDMNFRQGETGGKEGLYWLEMISIQSPETSVIMITAYGDVSLAVEAIKKGAIDFIVKPWQNEKMLATVSASFKLSNEKKKVSKLTSTQQALSNTLNEPYAEMIGNSNAIKEVFTVIEKVAGTDADVLILGENGTGKELIARSIHRQSPRRDKVFISVDAGALSESLFESELFGHVKGAFTDAVSERRGRFEIADGGTIFLDEIGNINLTQQAKLLSVLQNREVTPIGSNKAISIDVRVLCATNCDIVQLVREGKFREDLLYRINTVEIKVPPLRERLDDMKELADFFLKKFNHRYKKDVVMNEEVIDYLRKYSWPGNIRELQHALERALILSENRTLSGEDFNFLSQGAGNENLGLENLNLEYLESLAIKAALKKYNGNVSHAASELGLSRGAMYRRMEKYGY